MAETDPSEGWTQEYAAERVHMVVPHALPFRESADQVLWIVLKDDNLLGKWLGGKELTDLITKIIPQHMEWATQPMADNVFRVVIAFPDDTLYRFLVMEGALN